MAKCYATDVSQNTKLFTGANQKTCMTKQEAINEIEEYLRDADKAISEDEEYIRGWKSAMLTALEIVYKLQSTGDEDE